MLHQNYFVYMLTNQRNTVLYTGIGGSFERRLTEHGENSRFHFTRQYNADKLIYFEACPDPRSAIEREKQLKKWSRAKKEALIAKRNSEWRDLLDEMFATRPVGGVR
jgi:predicted GIY-YIG superfamily endonuclease